MKNRVDKLGSLGALGINFIAVCDLILQCLNEVTFVNSYLLTLWKPASLKPRVAIAAAEWPEGI